MIYSPHFFKNNPNNGLNKNLNTNPMLNENYCPENHGHNHHCDDTVSYPINFPHNVP